MFFLWIYSLGLLFFVNRFFVQYVITVIEIIVRFVLSVQVLRGEEGVFVCVLRLEYVFIQRYGYRERKFRFLEENFFRFCFYILFIVFFILKIYRVFEIEWFQLFS